MSESKSQVTLVVVGESAGFPIQQVFLMDEGCRLRIGRACIDEGETAKLSTLCTFADRYNFLRTCAQAAADRNSDSPSVAAALCADYLDQRVEAHCTGQLSAELFDQHIDEAIAMAVGSGLWVRGSGLVKS